MKYFTADTHFGEDSLKVGTYRQGFTIEEWNEQILDSINSVVCRGDTLVHLGDFSSAKNPGHWKQQIKCKHIMLVKGNHDASLGKLERVFGAGRVRDMYWTKVGGIYTVCSHYQQLFWDRSHHGSFHLHGHLHNNRSEWTQAVIPGARCLDVGLDSARVLFGEFRPFTEDEVFEILNDRPGHDHVSWYRANQPFL